MELTDQIVLTSATDFDATWTLPHPLKRTEAKQPKVGNERGVQDTLHASGFYFFHPWPFVIPRPKIDRKLDALPYKRTLPQEGAAA